MISAPNLLTVVRYFLLFMALAPIAAAGGFFIFLLKDFR